jgi:glycerate-2-kinase
MGRVPEAVVEHLAAGVAGEVADSAKEPHPNHEYRVVASPRTAAQAALDAAHRLGVTAEVITTAMSGESRDAAVDAVEARRPGIDLLICAGETTVSVAGSGRGGRNQEAALAAAIPIEGTPTTFLAADTDGIDGPTEAAGAVVDGGTIGRGKAKALNAMVALHDNDASAYLAETGDLLVTGPTGTNVASLWLAYSQAPGG